MTTTGFMQNSKYKC